MEKIVRVLCMSPHIGKEIEKKYQESGLKLSEFARRIDTGTRNIYSIFQRHDINSDLLLKISEVLEFDFFELYQSHLSLQKQDLMSPLPEYHRRDVVSINISLDGSESTLDDAIALLKRLNAAI